MRAATESRSSYGFVDRMWVRPDRVQQTHFLRKLMARREGDSRGGDVAWMGFFSPDSQWLGFLEDGQLKKVESRPEAVASLFGAPMVGPVIWPWRGHAQLSNSRSGTLSNSLALFVMRGASRLTA